MAALTRAPAVAAVALAVAYSVVGTSSATAQTREADAERLFREGQKLMEERRYGEACPKFEAAYKKDNALGTLINLAFCHKEQGATWYAWLEFREAEVKATEASRLDRRDFAHARLTEVGKNLPKVIVENPQKVPLTDVLVEDRKVWEAERGMVFAAEAGQRKFVFRAKGKKPATLLVNVGTATRADRAQHVTVPELENLTAEDLPPPPAPPPAPVLSPPADRGVAPPPQAPDTSGSAQRTLGWASVGVGGAAAVLGGVTGAITLFGPCAHQTCASDQRNYASTTGAISTVSLVAAGALVMGGLVLVLTAPSSRSSSAAVLPGWAGLAGTF